MSYKQAQKPRIQTEIPGPRSRLLRSREDEHLAPGLQNFALLSGVAIASALDLLVTDVDGNQFIDLIGGIGVGGIGHSHPKYLSALQAQMSQIATGSFTSAARVELCARVAESGKCAIRYVVSGRVTDAGFCDWFYFPAGDTQCFAGRLTLCWNTNDRSC